MPRAVSKRPRFKPTVRDMLWMVALVSMFAAWARDRGRIIELNDMPDRNGYTAAHFDAVARELTAKTRGNVTRQEHGRGVQINYPNGTWSSYPR